VIGLDTNVLVRYLVKDDPVQAGIAERFLSVRCTVDNPAFISQIVLCELVWVLMRSYKVPRKDLVHTIKRLLQTKQVRLQSPKTAWLALEDFDAGLGDFTDRLLSYSNREQGCSVTVTFDVAASRAEGMELLV